MILLLLLLIALCSLASRVSRLPLPLLQVALGAVANLLGLNAELDPATFMLLFIPPLLFSDAYMMPVREFRELRTIIFALAGGLVLFTTVGGGYLIRLLAGPMPLAAAFALAAVLSPTDAVAVSSITRGRPMPGRLMHVLSGEALLNDASGLVCFNFAVTAAMTGRFSPAQAGLSFLYMAGCGLLIGGLFGAGLALIERWLLRHRAEDAGAFVILAALLPFAAYLVADGVGASGILAAVGAGLMMQQGRIVGMVRAETRLRAGSVWEILTSTFNGMVFLLLGLQVPALVHRGALLNAAMGTAPWHLPLIILGVTGTLILLRLVWILISLAITLVSTTIRHRAIALPSPRLVAAMAVAGVRGAVTLAAVLSLAAGFPQRDLLVTVAAGVIVCSLVIASIGLPWLLSGTVSATLDPVQAEVEHARIMILRAASRKLEEELRASAAHGGSEEDRKEVITRILADIQSRIQQQMLTASSGDGDLEEEERRNAQKAVRQRRLELALWLRVLRVEREELAKMTKSLEINNEAERRLTNELDRFETVLLGMAESLPAAPARVEPNDAAA